MNQSIELRKLYWVIHTDHYGKGVVSHTKQVMHEVWRDGRITEEPLSERYALSYNEFEQAIEAYDWNEVLGNPNNYVKENK